MSELASVTVGCVVRAIGWGFLLVVGLLILVGVGWLAAVAYVFLVGVIALCAWLVGRAHDSAKEHGVYRSYYGSYYDDGD